MNAVKERAVESVLSIEGGYINLSDDPGGATRYGITEAVARAGGYTGEMHDLPVEFARQYYGDLWDGLSLTAVAASSEDIALEVFDSAVNMGERVAVTLLQRCLNVLNISGKLYADLVVDGLLGPVTVDAVRRYCIYRSPRVLLTALNSLQGARYIELAERNRRLEAFVYGWLRNRVSRAT